MENEVAELTNTGMEFSIKDNLKVLIVILVISIIANFVGIWLAQKLT